MAFQSVRMAWNSIISNKMRSFLTMLGIIIGVIALVVLVSVTNGATGRITQVVSDLGSNLLTVTILDSKEKPLKFREMEEIKALPAVGAVSPVASDTMTVAAGGENGRASVTGTTAAYSLIQGKELSAGRFLHASDTDNHTQVAVINQNLASDILGVNRTADAIGRKLSVGGMPFTVIGVLKEESSLSFSLVSYECYVPYTTLQRLSSGVQGVTQFCCMAVDDGMLDEAETEVKQWLLERFDHDTDAWSLFNMSAIVDAMDEVMSTMSVMLGGIAAISLLVGGIGIMNIMLVSVTERTREIGIRKAIGAGEGSILFQFLIEALLLSLMGDLLGVGASFGLLAIVTKVSGYDFPMDAEVVIFATVFSLIIGLIFGLYPARKAARKNPIDALHFN